MFKFIFIIFLMTSYSSGFAQHTSSSVGQYASNSGLQQKRVHIYDHGLQLSMFSLVVPPGWRINQNITTDPSDPWRIFRSYELDFLGPNGEFVTRLFPTTVYPSQGQNWEQEWWMLFYNRLGRLGDFRANSIARSVVAERLFPTSIKAGIPVFERYVYGSLSGRAVEGLLFVQLADTGLSLLLYPSVLLAPKGELDRTIDIVAYMTASIQQNPQYQIKNQQIMAGKIKQAQMLMRSNQQWFESHMASMRQLSALQTQSNREFSAYLKSSGYSNQGNEIYTTQDQFTDYLKDTTSFLDPYTGNRIDKQGQYEYWYTDGLGNYHGTNDPNFNPNQLNGDWSKINPLGR